MRKLRNYLSGKSVFRLLVIIVIFGFQLSLQAGSYKIPRVNTVDDYASVVYIDPEHHGNGDGTIDNPYNTLQGLDIQANTAYLIKAGTVLDEKISLTFDNNFIGKYGQGAKPILSNGLSMSGYNLTVRDLQISLYGCGGYGTVLRIYPEKSGNITIAHCLIVGLDNGEGYPFYILKGGCTNFTLYRNEMAYCRNDGMYLSGCNGYTFVSNYMHHQNMSGLNSNDGTGDAIQMEYDNYDSAYIANNYIDRSHTIWKFGLIVNGTIEGTKDFTCEANTFIGPRPGNGGAAVRWCAGTNNIFRKNLIISNDGVSSIETYDAHANQPEPYGVRDNHMVGSKPYRDVLNSTNLQFDNMDAYSAFLEEEEIDKYGSDIDPENFWNYQEEDQQNEDNEDNSNDDEDNTGSNDGADDNGEETVTLGGEKLTITSIDATVDDGNVPSNTIDGDLETRFSSLGDNQWIEYELNNVDSIYGFLICWYKSTQRTAYYDVLVSKDGTNWNTIMEDAQSYNADGFQTVKFDERVAGKFLKIVGHGNTENEWLSINEIEIYGKSLEKALGLSNSFTKQDVNVYPNPIESGAILNLQLPDVSMDKEITLDLIDLKGSIIRSFVLYNDKSMYLPELSEGVYFLRFNMNNQYITKKILVK